jgi:hypothetical protein
VPFAELFGDYKLAYLFLFIGIEDLIWTAFSQNPQKRSRNVALLEEVSARYGVTRDQHLIEEMKTRIKGIMNTSAPLMKWLEVMPQFDSMAQYTINHLDGLMESIIGDPELIRQLISSPLIMNQYLRKQLPAGMVIEGSGMVNRVVRDEHQRGYVQLLEAAPNIKLGFLCLLFAEATRAEIDLGVIESWSGEILRSLGEGQDTTMVE